MKHIGLIKELDLNAAPTVESDKEVSELYRGPFRRMVEVRLQNGAVLSRHKADVPITVLCLSGSGTFTAGTDLEDSQDLRAGTLITLEAGIEHEVTAGPSLHIIVTKFTGS
ncbi:MAG: hypothetical protein AB7J13_14445 [Pyrinomonadaceae bacterium]